MPKQHVLFGRPIPRIAQRRVSFLLVCIALFAGFSLLFTLPSHVPTGPNLSKFTDIKSSLPSLPKFPASSSRWKTVFNPFKPPSHPPPRQKNDTNGESSWYQDWKWLSTPFSSSLTLDENRSLLPPLRKRPPIYCYYDHTVEKEKANRDAESELLLTWRRAWWAQGFRPIILSAAEAMNNPMYEELQKRKLEPTLKTDLMRWLAWENMGGGLLAHYLLFPMGAYEEPLLAYLRRGDYPGLTRWKDLDDGLFAGAKTEIASALKQASANPKLEDAKDFLAAVSASSETGGDRKDVVFGIDPAPASLAFYNAKTIEMKYVKVGEAITGNRALGLDSLNQLISSHLQISWQNVFSDGIAVLHPLPKHTAKMIEPLARLAQRLVRCLDTPAPDSCPPNRLSCRPCKGASQQRAMKITNTARYHNATALYTLGTVPHPYTLQSMASMLPSLEIGWIRRESRRDAWIEAVTRGIVDEGVSGGPRVLRFKEAVAGEPFDARSLWITAERPVPEDVEWHFGFPLPPAAKENDSGDPQQTVAREAADEETATPEERALEPELLEKAKKIRFSKDKNDVAVRDAVEMWNLADTEAWRFARAFLARSRVERLKWEEEESRYAGGAGSEKGRRETGAGSLGRWLERD